jgi:hypothetical protein
LILFRRVPKSPRPECHKSRSDPISPTAPEVFERLTTWLRKNGVEGNKPLHSLRKEAGSIVATASGIFAASRFLRHRDIGLTASVYADQKSRVTVNMSAFLPQENVIALGKMLIAIRRGELI